MPPENTGRKQGGAPPFEPGHSGNPNGRPKGSRNKLSETFIHDVYEAWQAKGVTAINTLADAQPDVFVRVVAGLMPKQLEIKESAFDGISDDELAGLLAFARSMVASSQAARERSVTSQGPQSVN